MKYTFATKINGTEESGIVDMDTLMLICICPESNSKLLLEALNKHIVNVPKGTVCSHHWLPLGDWDDATIEQCTKCDLMREQTAR